MEAATASRSEPAAAAVAPPQVPLPRLVQTARFVFRPIPFFERWRRELGETFAARLFGPGDVVFISDPDSLKRLFGADRVNTIAPGRNIVLKPLLGKQSLLLQEGEEHLRRRKLMLPPFHGERMREYESLIAGVTAEEIARWPRGEAFAIHPRMQSITLEVIMRAVFGVTDEARRDELRESLVAILAESASPSALGLVFPLTRNLPHYRDFERTVQRTDELLASEIAERRADSDIGERDDILSMLIAARFEDGSQMSDGELRDQLMTLLLAGHETTATGLAWTFDLLLRHPHVLAKLERAVDEGDDAYVRAVVSEALRLRPVVPLAGRRLSSDLRVNGHVLPAGTDVTPAIWLTHTREDRYPEPYAFRPERFLDEAPATYAWIPFGGGVRRCIGAAFAEMEMRIAIAEIVRRRTLRSVDGAPERVARRNVTFSPRRGTRVIATPRG